MQMSRITDRKFVLVKRKTRLENLISRYNSIQQVQFYIEHMGGDFSDYLTEDERYQHAVANAENHLSELGLVQTMDREYLPNYIFGQEDIVVAVGQDGLVANTLKYLDGQPLIGVNPDPSRWDGTLLPFIVTDLPLISRDVLGKHRQIKEITLAKAVLNDGQTLYGVNDLFIGQRTHVSARYLIDISGKTEQQSSSGIIVSTGLGSTGWLKSIMTGASVIASKAVKDNKAFRPYKFQWDSDYLVFTVREPYPSTSTAANIVFGKIKSANALKITSQMPENGVIFSDGIEADYLEFNSGIEATISVAEKRGHLVV
jgi:NAD kinase